MFNIKEIAKLIDGEIFGDDSLEIVKLSPFFQSKKQDLTFASDEKMLKKINEIQAGVVIVPEGQELLEDRTYIVVKQNPRNLMPILLNYFKPKMQKIENQIEKSAVISEDADVSTLNTYVGHSVKIGSKTVIYPNVTILEGVKIGENCIIYPNVTIREFTIIGDNVIVQPGAVIGSDGFGFVKVQGENIKIEQIGTVIIESNVEIGANTCIDRGTIGETIIKKGTKIDNLVHIGHNCKISSGCILVSQVGLSGSTTLHPYVVMGGQSGTSGHLEIAPFSTIAARGGVTKTITEPKKSWAGFPLFEHREWLKLQGKISNLLKK